MHTRRAAIMFALTLLASVAVAAGTGTPALGQSGTRMTEPPHSGSLDGDEGSLAFQVDMEAGIAGYLATSAGDLRRVLYRAGIGHGGLTVVGDRILFELRSPEQSTAAVRLLEQSWPEVAAVHKTGSFEVFFAKEELAALRRDILQQTLNAVRANLRAYGIDAGSVRVEGQGCILIPPPAADMLTRYKDIPHSRSRPTFRLIDTNVDPNGGTLPPGFELLDLQGAAKGREPLRYAVTRRIVLQAHHIVDAFATMENGRPVVIARIDVLGRRNLRERLPEPGHLMAVVLDRSVIAATRLERRPPDHVALHGDFALAQAEELAAVLRASSNFTPVKTADRCPE